MTAVEPPRKNDEGFTLVELIVAIGLLGMLMALMLSGFIGVTRALTDAKANAQITGNVTSGMQRIDRLIRYADAINFPGVKGSNAYIEWHTPADIDTGTGATCTQLRYSTNDGTIALRQWSAAGSASGAVFSVIMRDVSGTASATYPFQMLPAGVYGNYQGLGLAIEAGTSTRDVTSLNTAIYARNSSGSSQSNIANASGQSQTPVCGGSANRP